MERPITIAHVDDHKKTRELFGGLLTREGVVIQCEAANGKELLEQLQTAEVLPDVCLLDLNMPVLNGFETAVRLRERYPSIKILAYSTNDYTDRVEEILRCGAHGFIPKDFDLIELKAGIYAVYNGQRYIQQHESSIERSGNRKAEYPATSVAN